MKKEDTFVGQKVAKYSPEAGYILGRIVSIESLDEEIRQQTSLIDMSERVAFKSLDDAEVFIVSCKGLVGVLNGNL